MFKILLAGFYGTLAKQVSKLDDFCIRILQLSNFDNLLTVAYVVSLVWLHNLDRRREMQTTGKKVITGLPYVHITYINSVSARG